MIVHLIINSRGWTSNEYYTKTIEVLVNVSSILCLGYHKSYAYRVQCAATSFSWLSAKPGAGSAIPWRRASLAQIRHVAGGGSCRNLEPGQRPASTSILKCSLRHVPKWAL